MKPVITDISGIGPAAAESLAEHRIKTLDGLASSSVEKVAAIPGFSETRAARVIAAAAELLAASDTAAVPTEKTSSGDKSKEDKKDKKTKDKKKKDKGKGKGKGKGKKKDKGKGKGKGKK